MRNLILGIDPGLSGAIAAITSAGNIELHDCPILSVGKKHTCNPAAMAAILRGYQDSSEGLLVGIEKVHSKDYELARRKAIFAYTILLNNPPGKKSVEGCRLLVEAKELSIEAVTDLEAELEEQEYKWTDNFEYKTQSATPS